MLSKLNVTGYDVDLIRKCKIMNLHRFICFSRCFLIGSSVAGYDKGNGTI